MKVIAPQDHIFKKPYPLTPEQLAARPAIKKSVRTGKPLSAEAKAQVARIRAAIEAANEKRLDIMAQKEKLGKLIQQMVPHHEKNNPRRILINK